mgnify:FL=1
MNAKLSPHASGLLNDIIDTIADALSLADALRWNDNILRTILTLEDYPQSGDNVPLECFDTIPPNADDLRQTFCRPYRIVYEVVGNEVHVLSIRHSRMLVTNTDTFWN